MDIPVLLVLDWRLPRNFKPQNPMEMTSANAMMRLMSEKGKGIDMFVFKKGTWFKCI